MFARVLGIFLRLISYLGNFLKLFLVLQPIHYLLFDMVLPNVIWLPLQNSLYYDGDRSLKVALKMHIIMCYHKLIYPVKF